MTTLTVESDNLLKMQEWLTALGIKEGEKIEVIFMLKQLVIRPQSTQDAEFEKRLGELMKKYDDVLRRLAES